MHKSAIHYSHRISAIVLTIIFLILISRLWFSSAALSFNLRVILVTQISLGIMNVVYVLPLHIAIAHNLVAALLLLATLMVNLVIWKDE